MRKSNMQAIASVGAMTRPQFRDLPKLDFAGAIDNYRNSRDYVENRVNKQAYVDALNGGNQDEINSAWANYDPQGYANHLEALKQAEIARQTHLEDQNFQRELQRERLQNAMEIAMLKENDNGTNTQRNVAAMVEAGYTPQEAWAMVTGGNNPTLDMSNLGKKGQEKLGVETAKNYTKDLDEYNNMVSKMPELEETVSRLLDLGKKATYTAAGQGLNFFRKQLGLSPRQSAVDRAEYISMIDNQVLPLLRDTFGAQFTEREGNTLRKTLGDADTTPEEKEAQLRAFIRQKRKSIESQARKLQSYQPSLKNFDVAPQTGQIEGSLPGGVTWRVVE